MMDTTDHDGCIQLNVDSWEALKNNTQEQIWAMRSQCWSVSKSSQIWKNVQLMPKLEETTICNQYANMTMNQSSHPKRSERPKSPLNSPARQQSAWQDISLSRDTS